MIPGALVQYKLQELQWVSHKYNCSFLSPGIFHNDTYSMYSRLFSFVTMISDPLGFRSTWYVCISKDQKTFYLRTSFSHSPWAAFYKQYQEIISKLIYTFEQTCADRRENWQREAGYLLLFLFKLLFIIIKLYISIKYNHKIYTLQNYNSYYL